MDSKGERSEDMLRERSSLGDRNHFEDKRGVSALCATCTANKQAEERRGAVKGLCV